MDPFSLAIGAVGLGMQIFGGFGAASNAKAQAGVSQDIAKQEQGINDLKQQQMEIDARRQQLQQIRQAQQAASLATARATSQGAQFGSGLQGGLAQITDASQYNIEGIQQGLEIGRGINTFNQKISADKQQLASLGGQAATDQGIASLGGSLLKAGPTIGAFGKNAFSGSGNSFFGGGSPSGY